MLYLPPPRSFQPDATDIWGHCWLQILPRQGYMVHGFTFLNHAHMQEHSVRGARWFVRTPWCVACAARIYGIPCRGPQHNSTAQDCDPVGAHQWWGPVGPRGGRNAVGSCRHLQMEKYLMTGSRPGTAAWKWIMMAIFKARERWGPNIKSHCQAEWLKINFYCAEVRGTNQQKLFELFRWLAKGRVDC